MKLDRWGDGKRPSQRIKKTAIKIPEGDPKNPIEVVKNSLLIWLNKTLGWQLTAALAILAAASMTIVVNWSLLQNTAAYRWLRVTIEDHLPLPMATGEKFTILVLRLENDDGDRRRRLISEALLTHFKNDEVQLLLADRLINCCDTEEPQKSLQQAKGRAEAILVESRADVIIWGAVADSKIESPIRLHWTAKSKTSSKAFSKYSPSANNYDLPPLFWEDLEEVMRLLASTEAHKTMSTLPKGYFAPEIEPIMGKIKHLLDGKTLSHESALPIRKILALAQRLHGSQTQNFDELVESIKNYIEIVAVEEKSGSKSDLATSYDNLGGALLSFGNVESDEAVEPLNMAESMFRKALALTSRTEDARKWAFINSNLAATLTARGRVERDPQLLLTAIAAHEDSVAQLVKLGEHKLATTLRMNLGAALSIYSRQTGNRDYFKRAIEVQRESISALTDNRWATAAAEDNLARTLLESDAPQNIDIQQLNEALKLLDSASTEFSQKRVPLKWATIQISKCQALWILGERQGSEADLVKAASACGDALSVFTRENDKDSFAGTHKVLGNVLAAIGVLRNDAGYIQAATTSYSLAMQAYAEMGNMEEILATKTNLEISKKEFKEKASTMSRRPATNDSPAPAGAKNTQGMAR